MTPSSLVFVLSDEDDETADVSTSKELYQVLEGEDAAAPVMHAVSSDDDKKLKGLLSHEQWIKIMLQTSCSIYRQDGELDGQPYMLAKNIQNITRAANMAIAKGHAAIVATLLCFAVQHDVSIVLEAKSIVEAIQHDHAPVFEAMALASIEALSDILPLHLAVCSNKPAIVTTLLELGVDPRCRMNQLVLDKFTVALGEVAKGMLNPMMLSRLPAVDTTALHWAAHSGLLDNMRSLIEHGADVNEGPPYGAQNDTPMHFAADNGQVDAMRLLQACGADENALNELDESPTQLLGEYIMRNDSTQNHVRGDESGIGHGSLPLWSFRIIPNCPSEVSTELHTELLWSGPIKICSYSDMMES